MSKFDPKVDGNTVSGDEYNKVVNPLKNLITSSGQTIDTSNTQVVKAVADYAAVSTFYTDSGTANVYVLSAIGSRLAPNAYSEGMEIRFRPANANTGASIANVEGLGVINIKQADGITDVAANDISPDFDTRARFDGTVFRLSNVSNVGNLTVSGKFNTTPVTETISSGAITYSSAYMTIDTEGGASSDNLHTINGGTKGDIVFISPENSSRVITLQHIVGNIALHPSNDVSFYDTQDFIALRYDGSKWVNFGRSFEKDFSFNNSISGWQYLPSGMIIQWGTGVSNNTITFPVAFPNSALNVQITQNQNSNVSIYGIQNGTLSTSGFDSQAWNQNGSSVAGRAFNYKAIGY